MMVGAAAVSSNSRLKRVGHTLCAYSSYSFISSVVQFTSFNCLLVFSSPAIIIIMIMGPGGGGRRCCLLADGDRRQETRGDSLITRLTLLGSSGGSTVLPGLLL